MTVASNVVLPLGTREDGARIDTPDSSDGGGSMMRKHQRHQKRLGVIAQTLRKRRRLCQEDQRERERRVDGILPKITLQVWFEEIIPRNVAEARTLPEWSRWQERMMANLQKYLGMGAIKMVPVNDLPQNAFGIKGVWAYSVKQIPGKEPEYKARLTSAGYSMKPWMYDESYATVGNIGTIRFAIREAAIHDNCLLTADSTAAFQNQWNPNYIYLKWGTIGIPEYDAAGNKTVARPNNTVRSERCS